MTQILYGRPVLDHIKQECLKLVKSLPRAPRLDVFLVGEDPASHVYVANKRKHAKEAGIEAYTHFFPTETSKEQLLDALGQANTNPEVDGILLQLPLPSHLKALDFINVIDPLKDVDGLTYKNLGSMLQEQAHSLLPCTPQGCLHLIKTWRNDLQGLVAVVVGRSLLVGKPMAYLLLREGCTVIQTHSKTHDLKAFTKQADILVVAAGRPHLITKDHIKKGACVIDVGIHKSPTGLIGDVDFEAVKKDCAALSPVPGGVGPTTISYLLKNTLNAALKKLTESS